jgi:hypothetical protein
VQWRRPARAPRLLRGVPLDRWPAVRTGRNSTAGCESPGGFHRPIRASRHATRSRPRTGKAANRRSRIPLRRRLAR